LAELEASGLPDVLITVDNGIVAVEAFAKLKESGVFSILTDHHQAGVTLPSADVVIHSTALCGTTVAWMLAKALDPEYADTLLDLCGMATIADQVPLIGANRSFAKFGLEALRHSSRLGIRKLADVAGIRLSELDTTGVNFGLVPRINAMGRLEHALDALRLLCTRNEQRAEALVQRLQDVNSNRQELTTAFLEEAKALSREWENESLIFVASPNFHEGVIGLIASKLTEEYGKPTVCLAVGERYSKGSCRSIAGVNITELLRSLGDPNLEVGGHPMAAGLRIATDQIESFKAALLAQARSQIHPDTLVKRLMIECEVDPTLLTLATLATLSQLEPYGAQNREPLLLLRGVAIQEATTVGREGKHLKLRLRTEDGGILTAIGFGMGARTGTVVSQDQRIDCVVIVESNTWNGRTTVQLRLKDYLPATPRTAETSPQEQFLAAPRGRAQHRHRSDTGSRSDQAQSDY
jgi:single-stranded-DNA-specific exonuclease